MKKVISLVMIVAVIGVGGWLIYSQVLTNPERLIIGKWDCTSENGIEGVANFEGYEFLEDGRVIVKGTLLAELEYEGKYTINKDKGTVTITYEVLGFSYNDESTYAFDGDKLSLTDIESKMVTSFVKVPEK